MEEKMLDEILDIYFAQRPELPQRTAACPSVEILERYVSGSLMPDKTDGIGNHLKCCSYCRELIEGALLYIAYERQIKIDDVPRRMKERAKSVHPAFNKKRLNMIRTVKKNIWLLLSLASIVTSFFVARYFLQFLILSVIFGLKWVLDRESLRTLIMIYTTWKKHDKKGPERLEEFFKDRL